jgi:hypothetical protein
MTFKTQTGAQKYNARMDKIFREAMKKRYERENEDKETFFRGFPAEKREKAFHFLNANYTKEELDKLTYEEENKILWANRKEWDY